MNENYSANQQRLLNQHQRNMSITCHPYWLCYSFLFILYACSHFAAFSLGIWQRGWGLFKSMFYRSPEVSHNRESLSNPKLYIGSTSLDFGTIRNDPCSLVYHSLLVLIIIYQKVAHKTTVLYIMRMPNIKATIIIKQAKLIFYTWLGYFVYLPCLIR